jgi:hypothetical protein
MLTLIVSPASRRCCNCFPCSPMITTPGSGLGVSVALAHPRAIIETGHLDEARRAALDRPCHLLTSMRPAFERHGDLAIERVARRVELRFRPLPHGDEFARHAAFRRRQGVARCAKAPSSTTGGSSSTVTTVSSSSQLSMANGSKCTLDRPYCGARVRHELLGRAGVLGAADAPARHGERAQIRGQLAPHGDLAQHEFIDMCSFGVRLTSPSSPRRRRPGSSPQNHAASSSTPLPRRPIPVSTPEPQIRSDTANSR